MRTVLDSRRTTRRATLGLAAGTGLGALGISPALFDDGERPADPESVWPTRHGSSQRRLFAPVDPGVSPGSPAWEHEFPVHNDPGIRDVGGLQIGSSNVYVVYPFGGPEPRIHAFDRLDGKRHWTFPSDSALLGREFSSYSLRGRTVTVFGDTLYVPISLQFAGEQSNRDFTAALDTETGSLRWMTRHGLGWSVLPAVVLDGTAYVQGGNPDEQIVAYQPSTGLSGDGRSWPFDDLELLAADSAGLFVVGEPEGSPDDLVLGEVNLDGGVDSTTQLPEFLTNSSRASIAVTAAVVLYGAASPRTDGTPTIGGVVRSDGRQDWERTLSDVQGYPLLVASDSHLFVDVSDRTVAIDPESGDRRWDRTWSETTDYVFHPVASPETLYLPGRDGIYRRDPDTGRASGSTLLEGFDVRQTAVVDDGLYAVADASRSGETGPSRLLKLEP